MEQLQRISLVCFLRVFTKNEVSVDKMMNESLGPVWHRSQKSRGIIPKGLRGVDKEANWGVSASDGWVYGHGSLSIVVNSKKHAFLGLFRYMPNNGNEAKAMYEETMKIAEIKTVSMDGKADNIDLFYDMKRNEKTLITTPRRNRKRSSERRSAMIDFLESPKIRAKYKERGIYVEPMQGIVKDIFDLDKCWMRGAENNRWIFGAMGVAV